MTRIIETMSLRFKNNQLFVIDQTKLPHKEDWIQVKDSLHMDQIIKKLQVRGAPLIGISAVLCLSMEAIQNSIGFETLKNNALLLRNSRPTAVNLMIYIDRMLTHLQSENSFNANIFINEAFKIFDEDAKLCIQMAKYGADLINDGDNILTHCNTGSLATAGIGTALGVIRMAYEQKKKIHVYVDETRPLLQGGRLTCYELEKLGIPYTLISDNMAAHIMSLGQIQKIFVGADRICLNGDFANKIGTQSIAVLANYYKIPFYTVAPYTTIDPKAKTGKDIPIELRNDNEIRGVNGYFGEVISTKNSKTYNPAFDVTPVKLITGIILDTGVYNQKEILKGELQTS